MGLAAGGSNVAAQVDAAEKDLKVSDLGSSGSGMVRYGTGIVSNTGDHKFGYVQVEINLLDKSGAVVGSTLANVNNLAPHDKWKFKALLTEDSATRFKVKGITAF